MRHVIIAAACFLSAWGISMCTNAYEAEAQTTPNSPVDTGLGRQVSLTNVCHAGHALVIVVYPGVAAAVTDLGQRASCHPGIGGPPFVPNQTIVIE